MRICRKIAALGLCAVLLVSLISMVFAADAAPVLQNRVQRFLRAFNALAS